MVAFVDVMSDPALSTKENNSTGLVGESEPLQCSQAELTSNNPGYTVRVASPQISTCRLTTRVSCEDLGVHRVELFKGDPVVGRDFGTKGTSLNLEKLSTSIGHVERALR